MGEGGAEAALECKYFLLQEVLSSLGGTGKAVMD